MLQCFKGMQRLSQAGSCIGGGGSQRSYSLVVALVAVVQYIWREGDREPAEQSKLAGRGGRCSSGVELALEGWRGSLCSSSKG